MNGKVNEKDGRENDIVMDKSILKFLMKMLILVIAFSCAVAESEPPKIVKHMINADLLLKQGDVEGAINEYEKQIEIDPQSVEAYLALGNIYRIKLKNNQRAIRYYLKGLQVDFNNFELTLGAMYSYFDMGDIEIGISYYEAADEINTSNKRYSFPIETVNAIFTKMDRLKITQFCEKYLTINPSDSVLREKIVEIYIASKEYQKAVSELKKMLKYDDRSGFVYFNLGTCAYNLGDYSKSLDYFNEAKKLGEYVPEEFIDKLHGLLTNQGAEKK